MEHMKFYECHTHKRTNVLKQIFEEVGITKSEDENDWNIKIPCAKEHSYKNNKYKPQNDDDHYMMVGIPNRWCIASKNRLWRVLKDYYGREKASRIMPEIFQLPGDNDIFKRSYVPGQTYILKNDKQRREGILLTNDKNDILKHNELGYHSIQRYIPNIMLHDNRRTSLRTYLLITCVNGSKNAYLYLDGFIKYALDPVSDDINMRNGVTANYSDEYVKNLGHYTDNIRKFFEEKGESFDKYVPTIKRRLRQMLNAANIHMCKDPSDAKSYQLFGVDFVITDKDYVYLLEVNSGPSMIPRTDADREFRLELHRQMLGIMGFAEKDYDLFSHFWSN